jgi:hypothetical protein
LKGKLRGIQRDIKASLSASPLKENAKKPGLRYFNQDQREPEDF